MIIFSTYVFNFYATIDKVQQIDKVCVLKNLWVGGLLIYIED